MGTAPNQASAALRFWRRLVGAAAIYALLMQPLLLAIAGPQLTQASAFDEISQLCQHQTDGSPAAPADQQQLPMNSHCLLCFAGAFHLLDAPNPTTVSAVDFEVRRLGQLAPPLRLVWSSEYSVARPRGPPLST
jgi:hypothetical protein